MQQLSPEAVFEQIWKREQRHRSERDTARDNDTLDGVFPWRHSRRVRRFIELPALPLLHFEARCPCSGKPLGAMQVIHDLRQGLTRKLFEIRIGPVLDLEPPPN